jgi:hypothetical protein
MANKNVLFNFKLPLKVNRLPSKAARFRKRSGTGGLTGVSGTLLDYPFTPAFTKPPSAADPDHASARPGPPGQPSPRSLGTRTRQERERARASETSKNQPSPRYQGILITIMRRLPRISSITFSRSERRLCSMPCHQRCTTSSGTITHTLQVSLSRSAFST